MSLYDYSDWRPTSSLEVLSQRASIYRQVREFFYQRDVLEVDTPILSQFGNTDPHIESFVATANALDCNSTNRADCRYLQTSPEFAMKRLLAAGVGSIYQMCKVFRHGEYGRYHNPEFTLLEWYRLEFSYHELMQELAELVFTLTGKTRTVEKITYQQAFLSTTGLDPYLASAHDLAEFAATRQQLAPGIDNTDKEVCLDLVMGQFVQPKLGQDKLTFVYDFPENRAALASVRAGSLPVAERFELFMDGIELANGYQELTDAEELLRRFKKEQQDRLAANKPPVSHDEYLIAACRHGLPRCAGVALGMDRLILLIITQKSIKNVLAFCLKNA